MRWKRCSLCLLSRPQTWDLETRLILSAPKLHSSLEGREGMFLSSRTPDPLFLLLWLDSFGFMMFLQLSADPTTPAHVSLSLLSSTFGMKPSRLLYWAFSSSSFSLPPNQRAYSWLPPGDAFPLEPHAFQSRLLFIFTRVVCGVSSSFTDTDRTIIFVNSLMLQRYLCL